MGTDEPDAHWCLQCCVPRGATRNFTVPLSSGLLTDTAAVAEQWGVPTTSAYRMIDRLVDQGILRVEQKIKGQAVWSVKALTQALDDFTDRAGRRTDSQGHWL